MERAQQVHHPAAAGAATGIDQHVGLTADPQRLDRGEVSGLEGDLDREALSLAQPVAVVVHAWQSARRLTLAVAHPVADAAHLPLEQAAGQAVEQDGDPVTGVNVAEVVLRQIRRHPDVVNGDQGHGRGTGTDKLACIRVKIRDETAARCHHPGVLAIQLGLVYRRTGAEQLGVVIAARPGGLDGAPHVGLGCRHLAPGRLAAGLGHFEATHRDGARIFPIEPLLPLGVLGRVVVGGAHGHQSRFGRLDPFAICSDTAQHRLVIGARLGQHDVIGFGIDFEQGGAGFHVLIVVDIYLLDLARHLGGDGNHEGLHASLGAVGGQPVSQQIPDEQQEDEYQQPERGAAAGLAGGSGAVSHSRLPFGQRMRVGRRRAAGPSRRAGASGLPLPG